MRIDYTSEADTGLFSQLAVMRPLQGVGIATMLIGVGEQTRAAPRRGLASRSGRTDRAKTVVDASVQLGQWMLDGVEGDVPGLMGTVFALVSQPA
jgi:hypothetical protein